MTVVGVAATAAHSIDFGIITHISSNPIALNPATASLAANPPGAKVGIPGGGHPEAAKVLLPGD